MSIRTKHRFLRWMGGGAVSFAEVAVDLQPSSTWTITWDNLTYNDSEYSYTGFYNTSIEEGVDIAAREHERRGGEPYLVGIVELIDQPVDTREDAVRCAAALATWKALGHSESEANVVFENGEWRVTF